MIEALVFDFDGLILDTEGPEYQSWREIYQAHGCSLPLSKWAEGIGSSDTFDPYDDLAQRLGRPVDRAAIRAKYRTRFAELMADQSILPGVEHCIFKAKELGLKLGLASSSSRRWVTGYLAQLQLEAYFDSIKCADDVERTKPDPALYLATLQALNVKAHEAIALEDSPNGVLAAKRAGIFCVAVPNAMTQPLSFDLADLQISSLAELSLEKLLLKATCGRKCTSATEEE
jgi:HAD superfamily hydrolase (TIGR01509 family)